MVMDHTITPASINNSSVSENMNFRKHMFCILTLSQLKYNVVYSFDTELQSYAKVYKTVVDTLERYVKKETMRLKGVKL